MTTGETLATTKIGDVMTTHVMAVMAGDSIQDAVKDLVTAFADNRVPDAMHDRRYYNIELMKHRRLV